MVLARDTRPNDTIVGSASDGGRLVKIHETTSPGDLLHLGSKTGPTFDALTIIATNTDTGTDRDLFLVWGTATPGAWEKVCLTLVKKTGFVQVCRRLRLARGYPVYAYASAADVVSVHVVVEPFE